MGRGGKDGPRRPKPGRRGEHYFLFIFQLHFPNSFSNWILNNFDVWFLNQSSQ